MKDLVPGQGTKSLSSPSLSLAFNPQPPNTTPNTWAGPPCRLKASQTKLKASAYKKQGTLTCHALNSYCQDLPFYRVCCRQRLEEAEQPLVRGPGKGDLYPGCPNPAAYQPFWPEDPSSRLTSNPASHSELRSYPSIRQGAQVQAFPGSPPRSQSLRRKAWKPPSNVKCSLLPCSPIPTTPDHLHHVSQTYVQLYHYECLYMDSVLNLFIENTTIECQYHLS